MIRLFKIGLCVGIVFASTSCGSRQKSPEIKILKTLFPQAFPNGAEVPFDTLHSQVMPFPGQTEKWVALTWGFMPGPLLMIHTPVLSVVDVSNDQVNVIAQAVLPSWGWREQADLQSAELGKDIFVLAPSTNAIEILMTRKLSGQRDSLYIETMVLEALTDKTLATVFSRDVGYFEKEASETDSVHSRLTVSSTQSSGYSDLLLKDSLGNTTSLTWNGIGYTNRGNPSDQTQRIQLNSISKISGAVPNLEIWGQGHAFMNGGADNLLGFSSTTANIHVTLTALDAGVLPLCMKLMKMGLDPGKSLNLTGVGDYANTSDHAQVSAQFSMWVLSSCSISSSSDSEASAPKGDPNHSQ